MVDKFTVFADKLSIPTSMCFANGGVIVTQAPDMLFLKDTKGTGHADVRKVLFTGWGTNDTHAGPSNLRYGFDNWIYGTVGYSGFDGEVNGERLPSGRALPLQAGWLKARISRLDHEQHLGPGHHRRRPIFGSTANGDPSWYDAHSQSLLRKS